MKLEDVSPCSAYWDKFKMPLKPDKNPGDVLHRVGLQGLSWGMMLQPGSSVYNEARDTYKRQLDVLYCGDGIYRRYHRVTKNPVTGEIYNQHIGKDSMSKDQMIPNLCAMYVLDLMDYVLDFERHLKLRNGRFTNTIVNGQPEKVGMADFADWAFYGLLDRCKGLKKTERIIKGDMQELAGTHLIAAKTAPPKIWLPWPLKRWEYPLGKPGLHEDPVNKTIVLMFNKFTKSETRDAQLARQIYAKKCRVIESWDHYWWKGRGNDIQCPFHIIYRPYLENLGRD